MSGLSFQFLRRTLTATRPAQIVRFVSSAWRPHATPSAVKNLGLGPISAHSLRFIVLAMALAAPQLRAAAQPVSYGLDLRDPPSHRVAVTMTVRGARPATEIQFPTWNALYQIRDFVHGIEHVTAQCDGRPDKLMRVDLNTWRSAPEPCATFEVRYHVYINEDGVFSSVLNSEHSFMNLAVLLFYLPFERDRAATAKFLLPSGWKLITFLDEDKVNGEYSAANYDALVDSPVEAGPAPRSAREGALHEYSYEQNGATYRVAVYADPGDYSADRLLASLERITATETALMRDVPFSRYTFILHLPHGPGGGGMEHQNGTAISVSASGLKSDWGRFESVAAHEFFHAWNVKRIRPQNLEPVDYVRGNDTRDLWFCEGLTSTYGELALLRAGLIDRREFYRRVAGEIRQLQERLARLSQSVEESGREAWLEKYSDYHRPERSISYYNKGEILGFLFDLAIRHASADQHSLDDVMRRLNSDFAKRRRFFNQTDVRAIIAELAPAFTGLDAFYRDYVSGTAEIDYDTYLGFAGLRLVTGMSEQSSPGFRLGRRADGAAEVQSVDPGSNAERAGLKQGDIVTHLNGRALTEPPREQLSQLQPGQKLEFKVRRGPHNSKVKFNLGKRETADYHIEEIATATAEQLEVRRGWVDGKTAGEASPAAGIGQR